MPKTSEIAKASGIYEKKVIELLRSSDKYRSRLSQKANAFGDYKIEGDLNEIVAFVKSAAAARSALEAAEEAERIKAQQEYNAAVAKILVTSGYSFEGYRIIKYSGYVSGDDAVSVDRGFDGWTSTGGSTGDKLLMSLSVIRQQALRELKEAALALDCNAVIGVDFDYITLDPQTANSMGGTTYYPYVFCVTANGTAVRIEKE